MELVLDIRGLAGFVRDAIPALSVLDGLATGSTPRASATALATLQFLPGGSHANVSRIADGAADGMDFEAIARQMRDTNDAVSTSLARLKRHREMLVRRVGMVEARQLDELVQGPLSKPVLRYRLERLAEMGDRGSDDPDVQREAAEIGHLINDFSERLAALHDRVLAKARGTK